MGRPVYLILHGYQGSGPGHWQTWLAGRLRSGDAKVHYPDLPDADVLIADKGYDSDWFRQALSDLKIAPLDSHFKCDTEVGGES